MSFSLTANYCTLQVPWAGVTTNHSTSPFAEEMYEKIKDSLIEYEVVINRWPQYSLILENVGSKYSSYMQKPSYSLPHMHILFCIFMLLL